MKRIMILLGIIFLITFTGCAGLMPSPKDFGTEGKELEISICPQNANIKIYSKTGKNIPLSQTDDNKFRVKLNGMSPFTIKISADDYSTKEIIVRKKFNNWFWGNIALLPVGGVGAVGILMDVIMTPLNYLDISSPLLISLERTPEYLAQQNKSRLEKIQIELNLADSYNTNNDYANAIVHYRNVLNIDQNHIMAKNNLEQVWNKRIAENLNIYPAPFSGKWQFYSPPESIVETVTYYEEVKSSYNGIVRYDKGKPIYGTIIQTARVPRTIKIPKQIPATTIMYEFNGSNYIKYRGNDKFHIVETTGTFFYDGTLIELSNGTVLSFENNNIKEGDLIFRNLK